MYPTLFKLPFLPDWLADIKSYGVMMMIAFLTGIWLACRRAYRSQGNPDVVLNVGFIALIFGVIGARAMYVLHYWETRFANQPNAIASIFDIRAGGLEFWGGPVLVIPLVLLYLRYVAKTSARWYGDMVIPSLAWGLAITRIGCFLNGCCWGAVCLADGGEADIHRDASVPWAVRFPYGSPAMSQQYKFGQLTLPKELVTKLPSGESFPIFNKPLEALVADEGHTLAKLVAAKEIAYEAYKQAKQNAAAPSALEPFDTAYKLADEELRKYEATDLGYIHAHCRKFNLTPAQLLQLASHYRSQPVHPAQLYAVINAFIICWVLSTLFYYRKRHGIVLGWFVILYSISRVFLEMIRQDNPLDVGGVTISQAMSLGIFVVGVLWLVVMHRLPQFSPRAVPYVEPEEEEPPPKKGKGKS